MRIFVTRPASSATFKSAATIAIAGAMVCAVASASSAETYRSHRGHEMTSEPYEGYAREPSYIGRPWGQCLQDEGQGRFTPCDAGGAT
jgi:hypothetical protein